MRPLLIPLLLLTMGSTTCQRRPDPVAACAVARQVETIDRNVYVRLRSDLTAPVVDPKPGQADTYGAAVEAADRREHLLAVCNAKLEQVRTLQGTAAEARGE